MISQLPSRVLKILEFIGFSGNKVCLPSVIGSVLLYYFPVIMYFVICICFLKEKGLENLNKSNSMSESLRSPLSGLSLLGYYTIVVYVLGLPHHILLHWKFMIPKFESRMLSLAVVVFFLQEVETQICNT